MLDRTVLLSRAIKIIVRRYLANINHSDRKRDISYKLARFLPVLAAFFPDIYLDEIDIPESFDSRIKRPELQLLLDK